LSTDMAVATAKNFLRTMAQPFKARDHEGISSWTAAQLQEQIAKRKTDTDQHMVDVQTEIRAGANGGNTLHAVAERDEYDDDIDEELMRLDAD